MGPPRGRKDKGKVRLKKWSLIRGMGPPRGEEGKVRVEEIRFQKSKV